MTFTIDELAPFGIVVTNTGDKDSFDQFSKEQIATWVAAHKVVLFRGYAEVSKQRLALFAQKLGKPLQWPFGAINDLKFKPDAENYIFTNREVPVHWDGAFRGTVPHIILFQCIKAPEKEDLGGTTFVHTEKILDRASAPQLKEWGKLSITYKTEKIVHYGGEITQKFIDKHEVGKQEVIRYAEAVHDLNPVALSIEGLEGKSSAEFTAEIKELLYDPANLYTHRWEDGDIVLADNHSLLHGRESYKKQHERYIQRINILHRPSGFSLKRFFDNCMTIRRKEFFIAELPIFMLPLLLSIASWNDFRQPSLYMGLIALFLLFNIGDMINCYADSKLDAIYKSNLSNAVYELGRKNVIWQIILSGLLALILTAVISFQTDQDYLFWISLVGMFLGLQYSIKPFKFKSRGILQFVCLWSIIFFGPMLYTALITNGLPRLIVLLIFGFYGFHQMGIILLNTAEDYSEDLNDGLNTFVIKLGFHRSMNFAFYLVLVSGIVLQSLVLFLFYQHNTPWFISITVLIFTFAWLKILKEYKAIIEKINSLEEEEAITEIKKNGMKVPEWLKLGAYSILAVIVLFTIWKLQ